MARDWQDLFVTGADSATADEAEPAREEERRGVFRRLLAALEDAARTAAHRRVVLDTSSGQPEALAMYRALGYGEVPDYNGNPYAAHWFEKTL